MRGFVTSVIVVCLLLLASSPAMAHWGYGGYRPVYGGYYPYATVPSYGWYSAPAYYPTYQAYPAYVYPSYTYPAYVYPSYTYPSYVYPNAYVTPGVQVRVW